MPIEYFEMRMEHPAKRDKHIGQWDFVEIGLYCLCNRYNFDIARRYAEQPDCQTTRYGEQRLNTSIQLTVAKLTK